MIKKKLIILFLVVFGSLIFFSTLTAQGETPEFVGVTESICSKLRVQGNYAYTNESAVYNTNFTVYDISNIYSPKRVGNLIIPNGIIDMAVSGNYAYTINGSDMTIIDISNPYLPNIVTAYKVGDGLNNITFKENIVYITSYENLLVIDIRDPFNPSNLGNYKASSAIEDVDVSNGNAYIITHGSGDIPERLEIVDFKNYQYPIPLSSYDINNSGLESIIVVGNITYIMDILYGLRIIDTSDLKHPKFLGYYGISTESFNMYISGNLVYIATFAFGLQIIDVSNPSNPKLAGSFPLNVGDSFFVEAWDVYVSNNIVYLISSDALNIINAKDPSKPTLLSYHPFSSSSNSYEDTFISGNIAYLVNSDAIRMFIQTVDISDPANMSILGSYYAINYEARNAYTENNSIFVSGNYAYTTDIYGKLYIFDISDPKNIILKGYYTTAGIIRNTYIVGNIAYLATGFLGTGLEIVDVSNPSQPHLITTYTTSGEAIDVVVKNNLAYVIDYNSGLSILDVSNPSSPSLVSSYSLGHSLKLYIENNIAYITYTDGLAMLDVSNPLQPKFLSTYKITTNELKTGKMRLAFKGNYVYITNPTNDTIYELDISNPSKPVLHSTFSSYKSYDIQILNNLMYLMSGKLVALRTGGNLDHIAINGETTVYENSFANYYCTAYYDDGTSQTLTALPDWDISSSSATITKSGRLTTSEVSSDHPCIITANYKGKIATLDITIKNDILERIEITGATSITENTSANYKCFAHYNSGVSKDISNSVEWSENSVYASISYNGKLTTNKITSDQLCKITATYQNLIATFNVSIINVISDLLCLTPTSDIWVSINNNGYIEDATLWGNFGYRHDVNKKWETVAGDFFGKDGLTDLACITPYGDVWATQNNGNGAFINNTLQANGYLCDKKTGWYVFVGDFNGDGNDDLLQLTSNYGGAWVGLSDGSHIASPSQWGTPNFKYFPSKKMWVGIVDINGDGKDDIIQSLPVGMILVALSNGTGFNTPKYWGKPNFVYDIAHKKGLHFGNFNGDGFNDIIQTTPIGSIRVAYSTGRDFSIQIDSYNLGFFDSPNDGNGWNVFVGDVNGDKIDDLIQLTKYGDVWFATSNGTSLNAAYQAGFPEFIHNPEGPWQVFVGNFK